VRFVLAVAGRGHRHPGRARRHGRLQRQSPAHLPGLSGAPGRRASTYRRQVGCSDG
jgi:hypothetical protein